MMIEKLGDLPIAEADRLARERVEGLREEMGAWRRARAERVALERKRSSVTEIAEEMGVHVQVVYDLLREARKATEMWWDNLREQDRELFLAHRDDYPLPVEVVERLQATRQIVVGARWADEQGYNFMWPAPLRDFLRDKADDVKPR